MYPHFTAYMYTKIYDVPQDFSMSKHYCKHARIYMYVVPVLAMQKHECDGNYNIKKLKPLVYCVLQTVKYEME